MNGTATQKTHLRFILCCITLLGILSIVAGSYLILRGYQVGEILITNGGVGALSGLVGFLSGKPPTPTQAPDVTISGTPPKVEFTQQKPQPESENK